MSFNFDVLKGVTFDMLQISSLHDVKTLWTKTKQQTTNVSHIQNNFSSLNWETVMFQHVPLYKYKKVHENLFMLSSSSLTLHPLPIANKVEEIITTRVRFLIILRSWHQYNIGIQFNSPFNHRDCAPTDKSVFYQPQIPFITASRMDTVLTSPFTIQQTLLADPEWSRISRSVKLVNPSVFRQLTI